MVTTVEMLNHRITLALGIIALVGAGLAFMDSRHASASDVQDLTQMIWDERIEDLEYKIEELERREGKILRVPEGERREWAETELIELENQKDRYIRKLERMLEAE